MRRAFALAVAVLATVLAPVAAAPTLERPTAGPAQAGFDFGDAPDGAPARYAARPRARGRFPSRAASGGPRHPSPGPAIGGWTAEGDSRQVDADADDGAQLDPRSCRLSTLTVAVDASRADPSATLYVNAWFDWNQDGDWDEGGTRTCGPEWAIQNMTIDPAALGPDRVAVLTLRFRAGRVPRQFWWRVQVHAGDRVPHLGGGGQATPTRGGETEDALFQRVPPGPERERFKLKLRCDPRLVVIPHGRADTIRYSMIPIGPNRVRVLAVRHRVGGFSDGIVVRRQTSRNGISTRIDVRSTEVHVRDPAGQILHVTVEVAARVNGKPRTFDARCRAHVVHAERVVPPVPPPEELTPAGGGSPGERADPATARCGGDFVNESTEHTGGGIVLVRCDGIDIKTVSISAGGQDQRMLAWPEDTCEPVLEGRALHCTYSGPNKGTRLVIDYSTNAPFASMRLHILAGGRGRAGTTIVLRQDWSIGRDGVRCRQSVPRADECTLPA